MRKRRVHCFAFLGIFVLFFVISVCGAYGLGDGDSLIVADFSGMPGDTVVDSVIAVNTFPVAGFSFRLVYDSTVLVPIRIDPTYRTDYFLNWVPELKGGWLYHYCFASGMSQSRPPLDIGRGAVAYIVFAVDTNADSGQVCEIEFQSDPDPPPKQNSFVDTLYNETHPKLKNARFTVGPSGVNDDGDCPRPSSFSLNQNYPNPFNSTTAISYQLSAINNQLSADGGRRTAVILRVYNIAGQLMKTLVDESQRAGSYSVVWDGRNGKGKEVSSGVYIYRLKVGDKVLISKKMILLR